MKSIRDWLNGSRDFLTGSTLYNLYGKKDHLKTVFSQGYSSFRQEKLVAAMQELYEGSTPIIEDTLTVTKNEIIVRVNKAVMPETSVSEKVDTYRVKWMPSYQEMNMLRQKLRDIQNPVDRGKVAFRILELERQCMFWWERREYYLRTGQHAIVEEEQKTVVVDNNQLQKRLTNIRSSISKKKRALEDRPADEKLLADLQTLINEKKGIEQELGNYTKSAV